MSAPTAILGAVHLDPKSEVPLYRQLYENVRAAILDGRLLAGLRMPPSRTLAKELAIGRNTVVSAYEQLIAEGYLDSRVGSGTRVAAIPPDTLIETGPSEEREVAPDPRRRLSERGEAMLTVKRASPSFVKGHVLPFQHGMPSLELFPHQVWARLLARRARQPQSRLFDYQLGTGFPALREAIAETYGLNPANILCSNGSDELLGLLAQTYIKPGDEGIFTEHGFLVYRIQILAAGGKPVVVKEDNERTDVDAILAAVTPKTRIVFLANPNNPTGAVYPESLLRALAGIAERHGLVLFADEIYDAITYDGAAFTPMATLVDGTLCVSFGGLSKVYRACGWRVGWLVFTGDIERAEDYRLAVEKLAALRLSSNVPTQWAVQTALGGYQSIHELTDEGGRLFEARRAVIDAVTDSRHLDLVAPRGAMYAFPSVRTDTDFDDHAFAAELLEHHHILVVPGTSFNIADPRHFRITLLPEAHRLTRAIEAIDDQLDELL